MAANINDKFTKVGTGTVTSLSAPGKAIAASSINIGSATNYPTDTAVYFAIRRVDPTLISDSNPSGLVPNTYTVWKGTVSGTIISNLALQSGGGADQVYPAGTNTQVFIDLTSAQMNSLIDGILSHANQDGTLIPAAVQNAISPSTITNAQLAGSITQSKFSSATGEINAAYQSWTPTLTNGSVGNGTLDCAYSEIGKTVDLRFKWTFGSTSTVSAGELQFSLPVNAVNKYGGGSTFYGATGHGIFFDSSVPAYFTLAGLVYSTTVANINAMAASGAYTQLGNMASFGYGTGDVIFVTMRYEAA